MSHLAELERTVWNGPAKGFYTIPEVAERLQFKIRDVYSWIKYGQLGRDGRRVFLQTTEFWPGAHIISWAAVVAYGLGIPAEEYQEPEQSQVVEVEFGPGKWDGAWLRRRAGKKKVYDSAQVLRVSKSK